MGTGEANAAFPPTPFKYKPATAEQFGAIFDADGNVVTVIGLGPAPTAGESIHRDNIVGRVFVWAVNTMARFEDDDLRRLARAIAEGKINVDAPEDVARDGGAVHGDRGVARGNSRDVSPAARPGLVASHPAAILRREARTLFADMATFRLTRGGHQSVEHDFGMYWRDGGPDYWRVSWVADTGDLYALRLQIGQVELLGTFATVDIAKLALKDWEQHIAREDSLAWARDRVRSVSEAQVYA